MERLTKRIDGHVFYTKGRYESTVPAEMESEDVRRCLNRLAAYEDTGLEPGEVITGLELAKVACTLQEMKNMSAELNRVKAERDAAVADLSLIRLCVVCKHSIYKTGIPCDERPDKPADGSCDFKWRGIKKEEEKR